VGFKENSRPMPARGGKTKKPGLCQKRQREKNEAQLAPRGLTTASGGAIPQKRDRGKLGPHGITKITAAGARMGKEKQNDRHQKKETKKNTRRKW